mmetsp:Transcript_31645/g.69161  ORF Transcript_31645/g.69161 Transcript_31645/m.69161 type:complete len:175 (-) Transcript_31645:327-851(-)|eukprot:CAMPEP_0118928666 /NCGR_PEP_ID=MMETSP1169-20130426/5868_1 /TAXON_ID=36882 /ORGANISM="Pyramimonas obovata, Strain CCMP722" /LENGTH=174 /DNA_ID=CAMNT_0006870697 /DNA_START=115 /DNA_END=639 /DNA_ORIENTATION=-
MGGKKKGAKMEPIFAAADQGDLEKLVECLKEDPKSRDSRNKDGWQPLHQAAFSGEVDIIAALLKAGANVNAKCNDGDTPLHYASAQGNVSCLTPLVKAGADLEARDMDGESPLDVAPSMKVKGLLRKLLDEKDNSDNSDGDWEEVEGDEAEEALAALEISKDDAKGKGKKKGKK